MFLCLHTWSLILKLVKLDNEYLQVLIQSQSLSLRATNFEFISKIHSKTTNFTLGFESESVQLYQAAGTATLNLQHIRILDSK